MAAPSGSGGSGAGGGGGGALSPKSARARLEEQLGKLDISEEEATPLVLDDRVEGAAEKWLIAGKVLHRNILHIQTISNALRPAWGNPKGLSFRIGGENMFVAEFATKRDRDRVWEGSPWHISKHAVILSEFDDCMRPSELSFDKLQVWARVVNLPFNLRDEAWSRAIAKQLDKNATDIHFDHGGGYLRARITLDAAKPLRRWILIESARRGQTDPYDIQYENIPHFCFSCGRLGHSDLLCPTPGTRDEHGDLPFGKGLRPGEEKRRPAASESSSSSSQQARNSKQDTKKSSTTMMEETR
nr:uncharacterized protein LOC123494119 [Aegilops tauschii subsp. strangulata]